MTKQSLSVNEVIWNDSQLLKKLNPFRFTQTALPCCCCCCCLQRISTITMRILCLVTKYQLYTKEVKSTFSRLVTFTNNTPKCKLQQQKKSIETDYFLLTSFDLSWLRFELASIRMKFICCQSKSNCQLHDALSIKLTMGVIQKVSVNVENLLCKAWKSK